MTGRPSSDPMVFLLLALSGVTGLVDAVSILGLGKVFTANMTGNVVFLGFALVGTPGFVPDVFLLALGGFLAGSLLSGHLGRINAGRPLRRWLMQAALLEAGLLIAAGLYANGPDHGAGSHALAIIVMASVAMGLRNGTVRQLKVPDLTTTVLTLTLTGLAADSRMAGGHNPNWPRRVGAVLSILGGAALGAALTNRFGLLVPLSLAAGLTLGATMVFALLPASRALASA